MLHLYQSNRLEYLAEMLATVHAGQPLRHPFAADEIVVQSQGMRRFITHFLAKRQGVAANIAFSLPAGLNWQLTRRCLPDVPERNPFAPEVMRWRLLALFGSREFAENESFQAARTALAPQIGTSSLAAYHLAGQLADVFDQYLVYRPNWIDAWQKGRTLPELGDDQFWQAELWRHLLMKADGVPHRSELWRRLLDRLETHTPDLPERYSVFGIAALAPMYLELLQRLSKHSEVHIFALNPSGEYWGNIIEAKQILAHGDTDLGAQGHPLLAALGKQGRDFFDALADAQVGLDENVYDDNPRSGSLLHTLQHQIQCLQAPEDGRAAWLEMHDLDENNEADIIRHLQHQDRSIEIHSAHSPLRELHILKDRLLEMFDAHRDWQPHDVAVLTPHIEPYAPYIEAVFGNSAADGIALPYSVSDVKLSRRQPLLYALEQTLLLLESRFETDRLLPLLESETVLARFGLSREDLPLLHDTVARLHIRWGADAEQRNTGGDKLFTWQQGLERLILGWMLPEHPQDEALWQGISPWHSRPDHLDTLAGFAALVRLLADTRREWQQPTGTAGWVERVRRLCAALFAPSDADQYALRQIEQALTDWQAEADLADFRQPLERDTAFSHIKRFLDSQSEAGFLAGGITFCSMVPMRSLPFKAICLLGLNDGDFPRNTKAAGFDLIAKHPQKGDRARRDDDRYLFLEALLSAREKLYLSFVGHDIRSNNERAPSTLLHSLTDCVARLTGLSAAALWAQWPLEHPLQAFSPRYFAIGADGGKTFPRLSGSRTDYAAALAAAAEPADFIGTFRAPEPESSLKNVPVEQSDFIRFWRNPVRRWLQRTFDWQPPHSDDAWDAAEPFTVQQPRLLADAYVEARHTRLPFDVLAERLSAQSLLPAGHLGRLAGNDYAAKAAALDSDLLASPTLSDRSGTLTLASGSLNYLLTHNHQHGQILYTADFLSKHNQHDTLTSVDSIRLLLLHLIYCAATPDTDGQRNTCLIRLPEPITLPSLPQRQAQDLLSDWLAAYHRGQAEPLPFFPRVSLAAAAAWLKKQDWPAAEQAAAKSYFGGFNVAAQADYPEIRLVYGRRPDAEPPYRSAVFRELVTTLLAPLSGCLNALDGKTAGQPDRPTV